MAEIPEYAIPSRPDQGPALNVSVILADEHTVERRRERRFEPNQFRPNQSVTLKVMGMRPGPAMPASVRDISGSGMLLRTALPVPCGMPVEIEARETLALGSVCRCEPDNGSYMIGVEISETGSPIRDSRSRPGQRST